MSRNHLKILWEECKQQTSLYGLLARKNMYPCGLASVSFSFSQFSIVQPVSLNIKYPNQVKQRETAQRFHSRHFNTSCPSNSLTGVQFSSFLFMLISYYVTCPACSQSLHDERTLQQRIQKPLQFWMRKSSPAAMSKSSGEHRSIEGRSVLRLHGGPCIC